MSKFNARVYLGIISAEIENSNLANNMPDISNPIVNYPLFAESYDAIRESNEIEVVKGQEKRLYFKKRYVVSVRPMKPRSFGLKISLR